MNPERLFRDAPPREPLTSLRAIVEDWQWRFIEGDAARHRDEVVGFCKDAPSWNVAVGRAVTSRRPNGKMHNHQTRVPGRIRLEFGSRILRRFPMALSNEFWDFDSWYDALLEVAPEGIGPVTLYDVAVRTAEYMDIQPSSLYLHAGVRDGWKALGLRVPGFRVGKEGWPIVLQPLPADQVEDLLCAYRAILPDVESEF